MSALIKTPVGWLCAVDNGAAITQIFLADKDTTETPTQLTMLAVRQLDEYFFGKRTSFDFPIQLTGTVFEQAVYRQLLTVGYGQTKTYSQIAENIGNPKAARAVGSACGKNPLLIVVPCHRIVGMDGSLTGFSAGLDVKRILLKHEGIIPVKTEGIYV